MLFRSHPSTGATNILLLLRIGFHPSTRARNVLLLLRIGFHPSTRARNVSLLLRIGFHPSTRAKNISFLLRIGFHPSTREINVSLLLWISSVGRVQSKLAHLTIPFLKIRIKTYYELPQKDERTITCSTSIVSTCHPL